MRELAVLHEELMEDGFVVLAFPSNDYHQELESNEEISNFWSNEFPEATFPVFALSSLADNPVYQSISRQLPDQHVKRNFFKYLVNREGVAVKMFTKKQDPSSFKDEILQLLKRYRQIETPCVVARLFCAATTNDSDTRSPLDSSREYSDGCT